MTNVQTTRQSVCRRSLIGAVTWLLAALSISAAPAQGPVVLSGSGGRSGGASEILSLNRRSFGTNVRFGHTAGNDVGRIDSITYLNLSPYFNIGTTAFIADLQLGRGNRGGLTGYAGGVYRTFIEEWDVVAGASLHHARDDLTGQLFRAWGIGVDVLTDTWEARANYVRPNGVRTGVVGQRIDQASAAFVGNNITFTRVDTIAEALEGVEVEFGALIGKFFDNRIRVKGFTGAYRYFSPTVRRFTGWRTHLTADVNRRLELDLALTEDTQFNTTVSFSAVLYYGGFKAQDFTSNSAIQRLADPVRRSPMIRTVLGSESVPGIVAIDPDDGLPIQVVHVDENDTIGPFVGTVEDPLNTLTPALGLPGTDVVFVHAGGVYSAAPDNMITVGPNLDVFGEGLIPEPTGDRLVMSTVPVQGIGDLVLPNSPTFLASQAMGTPLPRPTLSGALGDAVTLQDDSGFGGFIITGATGAGIVSNGAADIRISDTLVDGVFGDGILLQNTTGTVDILNTVISGVTGAALHVNGGNGAIVYRSSSVEVDPSWGRIENSSQQSVLIENTLAGGTVNMFSSTIDGNGGTGIQIVNAAGSATIDNAEISNSTANGILISNSSGTYTFRDSVRDNTAVNNSAVEDVLITDLAAGGQVTFEGLAVSNGNNTGLRILNNAGSITFFRSAFVTGDGGGVPPVSMMGGVPGAPSVSVENAQATSVVDFQSDLNITGLIGSGRGLELSGNAAGSMFRVLGNTTISGTRLEAIAIDGESGQVTFADGVSVDTRLERGISIQNSTGIVTFLGTTFIDNLVPLDLDAMNEDGTNTLTAVDIQGNEADIVFDSLTAINIRGDSTLGIPAGVSVVNNLAGGTNGALISFRELNLTSSGDGPDGTGLFALNNTSLTVITGIIDVTGGAAVDLEETTWDVTFERVSSQNSPDYGVRLVNAAPPAHNTFSAGVPTVGGTVVAAGQGGVIENAQLAAVFMANAGEATFSGVAIDQTNSMNRGFVVRNSGLAVDDSQFLNIQASSITGTIGAIDANNLSTLNIEDSIIDETGATPGGSTVLATYTELLNDPGTTEFRQFDNPYEVFIERTIIRSLPQEAVSVQTLAGADESHLDLLINDSIVEVVDGDILTTDEIGINVVWDGPSRINLTGNDVVLNGVDTDGTQRGFRIRHNSTTDRMLLSIVGNRLVATDRGAVGIDLVSLGPLDTVIDTNYFQFAGTRSVGSTMTTVSDTNIFLTNNLFRFEADGGSGFLFPVLTQPTLLTINGNLVQLLDETGLTETGFRAAFMNGTIRFAGTINNVVELLNPNDPGANIENLYIFPGASTGSFLGNGAPQP